MKRQLLLFMLAVLLLAGIVVAGCDSAEHHDPRKTDTNLLDILKKTHNKAEALAWLRTPDNKLRDIGKDPDYEGSDAVRFVTDLYARGAVHVYAVNIDNMPTHESTRTLIVQLPADQSKRRKLFDIEAEVANAGGFDRTADDGQHYMLLWWG